MQLIDSHCHLDFEAFNNDRQQVIESAQKNGVYKFIIPGDQQESIELALGLHPYFIEQHQEDDLQKLEGTLEKENAIAVGEIGLDYYEQSLDRQKQIYFFGAQLEIAKSHSLPVIVHARKSHDDVILLLKKHDFKSGGIIHAFNGSLQQAEQFMELGFKLGFGGMLTYKKSVKLRRLAKQLPLEAIVLETDAPDMTGLAHHGQRNSPAYLTEVIESLAEIRNENIEDIALQTTFNTLSVLNLD